MKRILCLFLVLVAMLSLCACGNQLTLLGATSEKALVNKYFRAFEKEDTDAILDLFYEPIVESERKAMQLNKTRYLKDMDKFYRRYGDDVVKKTFTNIQYFDQELLDFYNDIYFEEKLFGLKISRGCELTVDVVNKEGNEYTMKFNCFKISGKWYIYSVIK